MNIVTCLRAPLAGPASDALGHFDARALAHAFALAGAADQVTALLGGTALEAGPLHTALAAGADRAVRVTADDLAGADSHTVGQVLAIAIRRLGVDLILTGARSDAEGLGAVPAALARHLGIAYLAGVEAITLVEGGAAEVVTRGGGRARRLRVQLPAVLAVVASPPMRPTRLRHGEATPAVETLVLGDPESTVVRRRTELLGRPEPASRGVETVASAAALVAALERR